MERFWQILENAEHAQIVRVNKHLASADLQSRISSTSSHDTLLSLLKKAIVHDNEETRQRLYQLVRANPKIFTPQFDLPLSELRDLAWKQMTLICKEKLVSVMDFKTNPQNIFTTHECVAQINPALSIKLTVQFNLFGGTILSLGSEKQAWILPHIDTAACVGCFALTELGFGNNAVMMETTATYDSKNDEIIINSPTDKSQKFWITNGAVHATWAVVFAQLIIGAEKHGVHPFLVKIRDENLHCMDSVHIEDMGHRMGCNGVDNAKISFNNVRIGRDQMLSAVSHISEMGTFHSSVSGQRNRFLVQADQLLSGRLCIACMMLGAAKVVLTTAHLYSTTRLTAGITGKSDTPISNYALQRSELAPLVCRIYALNAWIHEVKEMYAYSTSSRQSKNKFTTKGPKVLLHCCAVKPAMSWLAERVVSICRERSGGMGFLSDNLFGEYLAFSHAGITAEGDNRVLWTKVTKTLLECTKSGLKCCGSDSDSMLNTLLPLVFTAGHYSATIHRIQDVLITRLQHRIDKLLQKLHSNNFKSYYDFWCMDITAVKLINGTIPASVAKCFCDLAAFSAFSRMIGTIEEKCDEIGTTMPISIRAALVFFGSELLLEDMAEIVIDGLLNNEEMASIKTIYLQSHSDMEEGQNMMIEAFDIPKELLFAPMAHDWEKYHAKKF